ncbi:MAG: TonB-dependent receptor [Chitinophagaceae bacterium]|nr:TonB-dependent receptor [Chitinophagaceae bacterium]
MKRIIATLIVISYVPALFAQAVPETDSSRIVELSEVTVAGKQKSQSQRLVNFFRANQAATLEDIISRLPEMSLIRRGPYGMEPSIRSFTGGQINVMVGGMRIHGACTDKMDPATIYIEPANLANLQVQTSTAGFFNGSSIGGTINMKIAEPDLRNDKKITGVIGSGYQTAAKGFYESARLNYSSAKWAFRASGTYRNHQNYRSGGGTKIDFSQFRKVNYSFAAKYQYNRHTSLSADILADDGWNIGYPALPMDVGYAAARIASVSINRENNDRLLYKWETKVYANQVRHSMDDTRRPFVPMHMDMPGVSKTAGAYSEGNIRLKRNQKLSFRADASATYLQASMTMYQTGQLPMYMLTWPDNRKNQAGLSVLWNLPVDSLLNIQLTGRADMVSCQLVSQEAKDQVSIVGNTAGRTDLLKNLSVQLSGKAGRRFRATAGLSYSERIPSASELYGFYLFNAHDGYDYIGNTDLKPERSLQAEVSGSYQSGTARLQVSGYYCRIGDYIFGAEDVSLSTMTIGARGVKSYINLPHAVIAGLEASAIVSPAAHTELVSTLRYTHGRDHEKEPLPFVAPFKNISSVRYLSKGISGQLECETALPQKKVSEKAGENTTQGYFLVHARVGYSTNIFKNRFDIQAGIENIFDIEYREHLDWGNIARPGRNVYVQLKVQF